MKLLIPFVLCILSLGCMNRQKPGIQPFIKKSSGASAPYFPSIGAIPVPVGYIRSAVADNSFADWLRKLPLKNDKTVYLYNRQKKNNQQAQYAVLDINIGSSDLLQCADAVIRLRAEYLFNGERNEKFSFFDFSGKEYRWNGGHNRLRFDNYLKNVFGWCGSASLEKQMKPVPDIFRMQAGDVLVKGGFPGHAVIVTDMAENEKGQKVYMLAQGYMPAQDIHILINPFDAKGSPWYRLCEAEKIVTPEWIFSKNQLRRW